MQNFKTVFSTLLLVVGFVFPSCEDDFLIDCDCSDIKPHFNINNLEIQNTIKKNDNWFVPITVGVDSINFESYEGINLDYIVDYHSSINWNFSLMNSAAACSCLGPGWNGSTTEKIETLEIITLNNFDEEHLSGSTINDFFSISYLGRNNADLKQSLEDFLLENDSFIEIEDLPLTLEKAPTKDSIFHVKVVLKLSTGELYEAENLPIKFLF